MKKFTSVFALLILMAFSASTINAQKFQLGAGFVYGTNIESAGISLNGDYTFNPKLSIAPSFTYFFSSDPISWTALNVDGHYKFIVKDGMSVYGIAGINLTFTTVTFDFGAFGGEISESSSNFGVNLGAGATKKVSDKINLFGELKYTISSGSYLTINAGAMYAF